jgi:broad specificity phosphatase PhoE
MTRLLLVRHGLTDWNAAQRFQGQCDIPLNQAGQRQASALAERLAGESFQAIVTSDLQRAQATAQAIAACQTCPVVIEARLREIGFGDWEGLTYAEIAICDPSGLVAWEEDILENAPPGGETLNQLAGRVQAALDELLLAHEGETLLLVGSRRAAAGVGLPGVGSPAGNVLAFSPVAGVAVRDCRLPARCDCQPAQQHLPPGRMKSYHSCTQINSDRRR